MKKKCTKTFARKKKKKKIQRHSSSRFRQRGRVARVLSENKPLAESGILLFRAAGISCQEARADCGVAQGLRRWYLGKAGSFSRARAGGDRPFCFDAFSTLQDGKPVLPVADYLLLFRKKKKNIYR